MVLMAEGMLLNRQGAKCANFSWRQAKKLGVLRVLAVKRLLVALMLLALITNTQTGNHSERKCHEI